MMHWWCADDALILGWFTESSFQNYTTCWVFLALRHMLYLCICVFVFFVFVRLTHGKVIFDILEQSSFQKYTTCWVFLALRHMLYLFICVFVFMYLCMRHLGISVWISLDLSFQSKIRWRPVFLLSSKKRTRKGVPSFPICSNILRLSSAKYQKVIFDVVCLPACLLFKHLLNKIPVKLALLYFYQASLPCSAITSASAATLAQVSLRQSFKINFFWSEKASQICLLAMF